MSEVDRAQKTFEELVPHGEESFMVLKAQLLAEHFVSEYVAARVPSMALVISDRNSPVRSGLALVLLAQALSLRDEVPPACSDVLWPALKKLNTLRNALAHTIYPNNYKITSRMEDFVELVGGQKVASGQNLNQAFWHAANLLVGYLAIDKQPLTRADLE
jgi:hypothetical protein